MVHVGHLGGALGIWEWYPITYGPVLFGHVRSEEQRAPKEKNQGSCHPLCTRNRYILYSAMRSLGVKDYQKNVL